MLLSENQADEVRCPDCRCGSFWLHLSRICSITLQDGRVRINTESEEVIGIGCSNCGWFSDDEGMIALVKLWYDVGNILELT
jgi:hypothetical protein